MRRAFTLVEVLVAFSIFTIVITLVLLSMVQTFKSFHQGEQFADSVQKQRLFFQKMARNVHSLVEIEEEGRGSFEARGKSFSFICAQSAALAEVRYEHNLQAQTLDRFYEEPADYDYGTVGLKEEPSLQGVVECSFSYGNGSVWKQEWRQEVEGIPAMVKVAYRMKDDQEEQVFIIHIPVSR